jgi:hypothetical protein
LSIAPTSEPYAHRDENAARAAAEIPGAAFVSLAGHTHFSVERVADQLRPRVLDFLRSVRPG